MTIGTNNNERYNFLGQGDRKFNVCSDVDEVVVNTAPKLCRLILEELNLVNWYGTVITEQDVLDRDQFELNSWIPKFLKVKVPHMFDEDVLSYGMFEDIALKMYKKHEMDFYDDLELSNFGKYLQRTSFKINHLLFVTHQGNNDTNADSKIRFLERNFGDVENTGELRVYPIPMDKKKSDTLNKVATELGWDIYIDDRCSIIKDVLTNCVTTGKTIMLTMWDYSGNELESMNDRLDGSTKNVPILANIRIITNMLPITFTEFNVTELTSTQQRIKLNNEKLQSEIDEENKP